jgi:hypothetical protein
MKPTTKKDGKRKCHFVLVDEKWAGIIIGCTRTNFTNPSQYAINLGPPPPSCTQQIKQSFLTNLCPCF